MPASGEIGLAVLLQAIVAASKHPAPKMAYLCRNMAKLLQIVEVTGIAGWEPREGMIPDSGHTAKQNRAKPCYHPPHAPLGVLPSAMTRGSIGNERKEERNV
jgi:hypothetical protein